MTFDARTAFEGQPRRETVGGTSSLSIQAELRPDERVLWSGQSHRHGLDVAGFIWTPFCVFALLFSLLVTLGSVAARQPLGIVWGGTFLAIALYLIAFRRWMKAKERSGSLYVVTSQRVMEKTADMLRFIPLAHDRGVQVWPRGQRGTIVFAEKGSTIRPYGWDSPVNPFTRQIAIVPLPFYEISDPVMVSGTVEQAAAEVKRGREQTKW